MRYPKFLKDEGTIGFVAPSFGCAIEPYKAAFLNAQKKWKEMGYRLDLGPNVYALNGIGISNTPERCGQELTQYYQSEENDCLISCGGGELMCEILDYVDFEGISQSTPKWFMGYSDNTNMTFLLTTLCDTASIYGPCAASFGMEPWHKSLKDAMELLEGKKQRVESYGMWELESLKNEENPLVPYNTTQQLEMKTYIGSEENKEDIAFSGRLLGGCVDCLVNLLGTSYDKVEEFNERYKEDGVVWFLECCDLNPMSIRRAMWQMEHAGWFKKARGFLIGRPLCYGQEMMGLDAYEAVLGVIGKYNVPIVMDIDLGHLAPMMPLVTGSVGKIEAGSNKISIDMEMK